MGERKKKRFIWLDELRGVALISMLIYHIIFQSTIVGCARTDILYLPVSIFFQLVAQILFISIAGISSYMSRNNLRRGIKILTCAIVITVVTYVVMPENRIFFGILHFLGVIIILYWLVLNKLTFLPTIPMIGINAVLFFILHLTKIGDRIFILLQNLFKNLIHQKWLCFFGLPDKDFISSDYFPIFPWIFLFLFGVFLGKYIKENERKFLTDRKPIFLLSFIGRHTLFIYMIHIPIIWIILFPIKIFVK
ncbi:MAG: heparan-alpha-glucosaminide N-acetyltransferase domain-containing protein [Lachnospiraceae bacterium]